MDDVVSTLNVDSEEFLWAYDNPIGRKFLGE
jgi:hypothetical protein